MLPPNVVTFFHPEPLNMCSSAKIEVIEGSPKLVENKNTVYSYTVYTYNTLFNLYKSCLLVPSSKFSKPFFESKLPTTPSFTMLVDQVRSPPTPTGGSNKRHQDSILPVKVREPPSNKALAALKSAKCRSILSASKKS